MRYVIVGLAASLILQTVARSAEPDPQSATAAASTTTAGAHGHGTDLRRLIADVAVRTHRHFVIDPRAGGEVDIEGLEPRDVTYPQLLSILQVSGLIVVQGEGVLEVVPNADSRQQAMPVVKPDEIPAVADEFVTCILVPKNVSATQLVPILRPLIPQYGHLAAFPERNALLIADRSGNVRRIVELVRTLDALPKWADYQPPKAPDKP